MGTGHVFRALSLAEAWRTSGGDSLLAIHEATPALRGRIDAAGFESIPVCGSPGTLEDAEQTAALATERGAGWVVVDGYHFGYQYQEALLASGVRVLFVDDYGHAEAYVSHLVLNQNAGADPSLYAARAPRCRLMLGPDYALLGPSFVERVGFVRSVRSRARHLLVTFGGSDPSEATLLALEALPHLTCDDIQITIAVGGSNPALPMIRAAAARISPTPTVHPDPRDLAALMADADLALGAGGTTAWEFAFMGVPQVLLVLAQNQRVVAECLDSLGVAVNLGEAASCSPRRIAREIDSLIRSYQRRAEMAIRGQALVDGRGTERVVSVLQRTPLRLRNARLEDCERIFKWANDPVARTASFQSDEIPWEDHQEWFERKLSDSNCYLLIGEDGSARPVGQVRFELDSANAVVSVSTDPEFRGLGYGRELLSAGMDQVSGITGVERFTAYVKPNNNASLQLFEAVGFERGPEKSVSGERAVSFLREVSLEGGSKSKHPGGEHAQG